jgi:hypothetical protein
MLLLQPLTTSPQASSGDNQSFVHTRMGIWNNNGHKRLPNNFGLEDIKGAAATIVIAGNDTVSCSPRAI